MAAVRVLYHAVGGGLGHGMRALAVARQLARRVGGRHRVVVNTPFADTLAEVARREAGVELLVATGGRAEIEALLWEQVRLFRPGLWVVDTLPRGVVGELIPLLEGWSGCPRVLVARPLKPAYVRDCGLEAWVRRHYDLVLVPGERGPLSEMEGAAVLPPFMIRDRDELPAREQALALVQSREPVVLIAGTGHEAECREWCAVASRLARTWPADAPPLRLALPRGVAVETAVIRYCPLIECLPAVRLLIGSAGYHLVHEARFARVAGLFRPRQRQYDDQAGRLRPDEVAGDDLRGQALQRLCQPMPSLEPIANGAILAAQRIAAVFFCAG
jgi:hypothetical protein